MIYLWLVVLFLIGAVITLYILLTRRPKNSQGLDQMKKEMVATGRLFEQLEFKIDNLKHKVLKKKNEIIKQDSSTVRVKDHLDEIEKDLEDISKVFLDKKENK